MRLRQSKPISGRGREPRIAGKTASPAFSYYNNRPAEPVARKSSDRQAPNQVAQRQQLGSRFSLSQIPFWLLVVISVISLCKLIGLSTTPQVRVVGTTPVTKAYVRLTYVYVRAAQTQLSRSLTNRTKLTANVNGTARALEKQFPELQTVSIALPLMGSQPILYALVAQPSLVLQTTHGNYAVNGSGLVLAKLTTLPAGIPLVTDPSGIVLQPGTQFLPGSTVAFVQTVAYQFKAAHYAVANYVLPQASPYELDVHLENKPYSIRFNLQEEPVQQSGAALATLIKLGRTTPLEYLDVRVPERSYYK